MQFDASMLPLGNSLAGLFLVAGVTAACTGVKAALNKMVKGGKKL